MLRQLESDPDRVIIEATFPMSQEDLFDHFTKPDLLQLWWPQEATTEPKEGGEYQFSWPTMDHSLRGEYTRFEPPVWLTFTWRWVHQPDLPTREVNAWFSPNESGSALRLEHGYYGTEPEELEDRQNHIDGWLHFLKKLQTV